VLSLTVTHGITVVIASLTSPLNHVGMRFVQACQNLCTNALRMSTPTATVCISMQQLCAYRCCGLRQCAPPPLSSTPQAATSTAAACRSSSASQQTHLLALLLLLVPGLASAVLVARTRACTPWRWHWPTVARRPVQWRRSRWREVGGCPGPRVHVRGSGAIFTAQINTA
jgi:hypothetical protein